MRAFNLKPTITIVGCSGYGNVGDDTYVILFKKYLKEYKLTIKNSDPPRKLPKKCDFLVFGGGGMIYEGTWEHFNYMKQYMDEALKRGIPYAFISCGVQTDSIASWEKYLDKAELITVRSSVDVELIKSVSINKNIYYHPDLCYLFDEFEKIKLPDEYEVFIPTRESKLNKEWLHRYKELPSNQKVLLRLGSVSDTKKAFSYWKKLSPAIFIEKVNPEIANYVIKNAKKVFTHRYHGLIFARKNKINLDIKGSSLLKIKNENIHSNMDDAAGHITKLKEALKNNNLLVN